MQGMHRVQQSSTLLPDTSQPCKDHIRGSSRQQGCSAGRGEPQPMPSATQPAGASISANPSGFVSKKSTPNWGGG